MRYVIIFSYIFAFYIFNISVSILIAFPLYFYSLINVEYRHFVFKVFDSTYIKQIIYIWFVLIVLALLFPVLFFTYDISFFKIIFTQIVHLIAAIPVLAYISYNKFTAFQVEKIFVNIFIIQSVIQLIVLNSEYLSDIILFFNKYDSENISGPGAKIRGKALSAATTYHLSIAYGIAFIIFIKNNFANKISILIVIKSILLISGIFFAGRSGFVAVVIGLFSIILIKRKVPIKNTIRLLIIIVSFLVSINYLLHLFFNNFYHFIYNVIFPYGFEFFYSLSSSGDFESQSTNRLLEMWNDNSFNLIELLFGTGKYTNPDGSYYMKVDPGILRHTLFFGIIGYFMLVIYQLKLLPFFKFKKRDKIFSKIILLYFFLMEFKAVTLGVNKFVFSISILLSYCYLYLDYKEERIN